MEAREPADEPEPEEAVQSDDESGGLGADGGADVRGGFSPWLSAARQASEPGPADDLDGDAEGRGRGDEEQEEAVVPGLRKCFFLLLLKKLSFFSPGFHFSGG